MSFCDQDYDYEPTDDDIRRALDDEALYWSGYNDDAPSGRHEYAPDSTCPFCRGDLSVTNGFRPYCPTCDVRWDDDDELIADRDLDFADWLEERATR